MYVREAVRIAAVPAAVQSMGNALIDNSQQWSVLESTRTSIVAVQQGKYLLCFLNDKLATEDSD